MRVMVTGAQGFLGRETVRLLHETGDHHVIALDVETDLRNQAAIGRALRDAEPDVILHLGGISGPMVRAEDPSLVTAVNTVGTVNLLHSALRLSQQPRVVLASSIAALEQRQGPMPSIYAATKRFMEDAAEYFASHGLEVLSIRLGSVYGPGRTTDHVVQSMARSLSTSGVAEYDPEAHEPLIHVHDAARVLLAAMGTPYSWPGTLVAVQQLVSHRELATLVAAALGVAPQLKPALSAPWSWSESLDSGPLEQALGFAFQVPVRQGVEETARAVTA